MKIKSVTLRVQIEGPVSKTEQALMTEEYKEKVKTELLKGIDVQQLNSTLRDWIVNVKSDSLFKG